MHSEYRSMRMLGSFSIDDPDAGRKLIENLDRRRVRVQVIEMCWHFGIPFPDQEIRDRVQAFLDGLCRRGELVKVAGGLYCRPDMTTGRASVGDAFDKLAALCSRARPAISMARPTVPKPPVLNLVPPVPPPAETPAPAIVEAGPSEPPKPKPIPNLQRQTEWILRWMRTRGGVVAKTATADAAVAAGIVAERSDLDVPLQHLFNRTRAYLKGGQLALTQFGERDAEYLDLRRTALEAPITNDA